MENSKQLVQQAGIVPYLKLAVKKESGGVVGTGKHFVKIIDEKLIKTTNFETGEQVPTMRYFFEENGEKKQYDVEVKDRNGNLHYLIQRFAEIEKDSELILEYQRKGVKGFINVELAASSFAENEIPKDDTIPVVEDDPEGFKQTFGE